jgi:uncharacterized protein DUF4255/IPT/TIG domain-containing protein
VSNFLAVAAVTASLSHLLQSVVGADVPGATVTTVRPDAALSATHPPVVHLFLYQVLANPALRNADLPTRRGNGALVETPVAALDLHYLLTFYGDDAQLEPQRLLGSSVRTLHQRPVLSRDVIQSAITDPTFAAAVGQSDLGDQVERVRITPAHLSLEELSKVWSVFFQTPYALSAAYRASVVLIEGDQRPQPASLPVRQPSVTVATFRQPVIERVESAAGPQQPILAGSTIAITGHQLRGDSTQVRIGTQVLTPTSVSDTRVTGTLPVGLRAGVQSVQIVQGGFESNAAAFLLRPSITAQVANVSGSGAAPRSADLTVTFVPTLGQPQRVGIALSQVHGAAAFTFVAPARTAADTASITLHITGIPAGTYLVRAQVDGAESVPSVNAAGEYDTPGIALA